MARSANVEPVVATADKKAAIAAQVSFNFGSLVRQAAENEGTTISGYITRLVYNQLGVELPESVSTEAKGTPDKVTLSASVDNVVKTSFDTLADDSDETTSGLLKKLLADAIGYDLSLEPKVDRAQAMRVAAETRRKNTQKQTKTMSALMELLKQLAPDKVDAVLASIDEDDS